MEKLTAAHKKLPFETWVEVTNLRNGKQVGVRINDRGPFVRGRIIDLSRAAAAEIDMIRTGTDRVRLKVVAAPPGRAASVEARYAVQAGAFEDRSRAEALRAAIGADRARVVDPSGDDGSRLWRVLVGRNLTSNDAARLATEVRRVAGDAIVVRER
jgi:rare lipoprotein A